MDIKILSSRELSLGLRDGLEGLGMGGRWEEIQERGDICIPMVNSC